MEPAHQLHCPNLIATAKQMSLLSLYALLFLQSHLFLICVVLTYNDSRISLHKTCLILRKCQCKWLWVSLSAPRTFVRSFLFPEKFLFCTGKIVSTVLPSLVPQYSISMIVAWFTSFAKNSVIRCYQTTRIFRSGTTVPVRLLQEALVNFVFKQISQFRSFGKCVWTLCIPEPGSTFCSRLHWKFMRCLGSASISRLRVSPMLYRNTFIDQIFSELLQPVRKLM